MFARELTFIVSLVIVANPITTTALGTTAAATTIPAPDPITATTLGTTTSATTTPDPITTTTLETTIATIAGSGDGTFTTPPVNVAKRTMGTTVEPNTVMMTKTVHTSTLTQLPGNENETTAATTTPTITTTTTTPPFPATTSTHRTTGKTTVAPTATTANTDIQRTTKAETVHTTGPKRIPGTTDENVRLATTTKKVDDLARCPISVIDSHKYSGKRFNFNKTTVGTLQRSTQNCQNSNYSATVECVKPLGSKVAFFDHSSLKEYFCERNTTKLLQQVKTTEISTETLDSTVGTLEALSTDLNSSSNEQVTDLIDILNVLQNETKSKNITVEEDTVTNLVSFTDNVHEVQRSGRAIVDDKEKTTLIRTQEVLASYLEIDAGTIRKSQNSLVFQANKTNCSTAENQSIYQSISLSNGSAYKQSVEMAIPSSIFKKRCSDEVTVVLFLHKDGVLFPSPKENNVEINQVLSAQLARIPVHDSEDPVSFDFIQPPATASGKRV